MTSVGNPAKMQDAKEQIFSAFLGIVILLFSYLILATINPQLVMFRIPTLTEPEICKTSADCPPGVECIEKKCVIKKCESDAGCPEGFSCNEETKTCVIKHEVTLISLEIPLGQMIENGVWKKENIETTKKALDGFEAFLKEDISVNPTFNRISDLNKYLKTLTEDCRCDRLTPICGQPQNWGGDVGCAGDPCKDSRKNIEKILAINREKIKKLLNFKKEIEEKTKLLKREENKFVSLQRQVKDCIEKNGELLTLNEYLSQVEIYEEQGWKTVVLPRYLPSNGDPLTFYCARGGTIFDTPRMSPVGIADIPEELTPTEVPPEAMEVEQLSCPAEIPVGEILDDVGTLTFLASADLQELMIDIDVLVEKISSMGESISKCNDQSCDITCGGVPNPCYQKVCGCIPVCPGDPPFPNPCYPNPFGPLPTCAIPKLQELGICVSTHMDAPFRGYPCPRDDIEETARKIKLYEDEIFSAIKRIKESFSNASYTLNDAENPLRLDVIRKATSLCFSPSTEETTWALLDCEMALGNYGPDGAVITGCHPGNFFCCTSSKELAKSPPFPSAVEKPQPSASSVASGMVFPPSKYGKNNVPYFSQNRPAIWANDRLGNCRDSTTIAGAGCKLTSTAMVFKYYGVETDPGRLNKQLRSTFQGCLIANIKTNASIFGLKATKLGTKNTVVQKLKEGNYPIIVGFRGGVAVTGSKGQHWIVLTGIDKDYVYKNDPISSRGIRGIPIDTFLRTPGFIYGELITK